MLHVCIYDVLLYDSYFSISPTSPLPLPLPPPHPLYSPTVRFFGSIDQPVVTAGIPGGRLELMGCLVAGAHSFSHVGLSRELAMASPELTLPMFCGKLDEKIMCN